MSICKLKVSLLSIWTPNILTSETTLIFSLSIVIFSFRCKSEFFLSNEIAWNLSGLTVILLSLNQFMAQLLSDSKMLTRFFTVLAKLDKVLSSAKLWTDTLHRKKKKSLKKILNKTGPTIEPCGTPDFVVWKFCLCYYVLHNVSYFPSMNKYKVKFSPQIRRQQV